MKVFREPVYPEWPELKSWCEEQIDRKESDRVFASLEKKQQSQQRPQRQAPRQRKRIASNERPKSFNHYFALLTAETQEKRRIEEEEFEQEQKMLEQKWLSRRDNSYSVYA
jgi:hypothetical protein